jgi:hypothetical protein
MKPELTVELLCKEAKEFALRESKRPQPKLFGVTDGKAVGTYVEHKFQGYLAKKYDHRKGNSASGIDFPSLNVDMKVTSITQPQSSCPYKSARQKIFGLGYSLLVFVYDKKDNPKLKTGRLTFRHIVYIDKTRTADYQITTGLRQILENEGNLDDITAFMGDQYLPVDEIQARKIAKEVSENLPPIGYLPISEVLQWRLQYGRTIEEVGKVDGVDRIL